MARVLLVSSRSHLLSRLMERDCELEVLSGSADLGVFKECVERFDPALVVLFGTNVIVPSALLSRLRAVNIHSSMLPMCRGPVPHLWSIIEGVPIGVTVHEVDSGIDTGPIIAQERVDTEIDAHSLQSIYELLHARGALLFARLWPEIRDGTYTLQQQTGPGSLHSMAKQKPFQSFLDSNLKMRLPELIARLRSSWEFDL